MLTREDLPMVRTAINSCEVHGYKLFGAGENVSARQAIEEHYAPKYSPENLNFLMAINEIFKNPQADLQTQLSEIYKSYISKDAEFEINIPGSTSTPLRKYFNADDPEFIFGPTVKQANKDDFDAQLKAAVRAIVGLIISNIPGPELNERIEKINQQNPYRIFESLEALPNPGDLKNVKIVCDYAAKVCQEIDRIYVQQDRQRLRDLIQRELRGGRVLTHEISEKLKTVMNVYEVSDKSDGWDHEHVNYRVGLFLNEVGSILEAQEKREIKDMIDVARREIKIYPYTGIEKYASEFDLPSLAEYVKDPSGQEKRKAAITDYDLWKKFVKDDKIAITTTENYLNKNQLTRFDEAYKAYATSLDYAKNPLSSNAAKVMSGVDSIKAACEAACLVSLKNLIKEIDSWLDWQSKNVSNEKLKTSKVFHNILGLKVKMLEAYADKMEVFINTYQPVKSNLSIQASFFHASSSSSDGGNSPIDSSRLESSNSGRATTSNDSSGQSEDNWWDEIPGRTRGKSG